MAKRRIPNRHECLSGIESVLANADAHLEAADLLSAAGKHGFAVAHLVYALEEGEKARTLGKVALGENLTVDEIRGGLYEHRNRHVGVMTKSLSSGGAAMDFIAESLMEKAGHRPVRSEVELWADIEARHPEVLPRDWAETGGDTRTRNLYTDLGDTGWTSPSETDESDFAQLRPAVVSYLSYLRGAIERQIVPMQP